jgi:hypothetical protein
METVGTFISVIPVEVDVVQVGLECRKVVAKGMVGILNDCAYICKGVTSEA